MVGQGGAELVLVDGIAGVGGQCAVAVDDDGVAEGGFYLGELDAVSAYLDLAVAAPDEFECAAAVAGVVAGAV